MISWNIRGYVDVKLDMLAATQSDIICLQETKCQFSLFQGAVYKGYSVFESNRSGNAAGGGIATFVPSTYNVLDYRTHDYFLVVLLRHVPTQTLLICANVYIPPHTSDYFKGVYADALADLTEQVDSLLLEAATNCPVLLAGDFNARIGSLSCTTLASAQTATAVRNVCDYTVNARGQSLVTHMRHANYTVTDGYFGKSAFTRQSSAYAHSTLDYVFVKNMDKLWPDVQFRIYTYVAELGVSDHSYLYFTWPTLSQRKSTRSLKQYLVPNKFSQPERLDNINVPRLQALWEAADNTMQAQIASQSASADLVATFESCLVDTIRIIDPSYQPYVEVKRNVGAPLNPNKATKHLGVWFDAECKGAQ